MLGSRQKKRPKSGRAAAGVGVQASSFSIFEQVQVGFVFDVVLAAEKERVGAGAPAEVLPPMRTAQPSQTAFLQIGQRRQREGELRAAHPAVVRRDPP